MKQIGLKDKNFGEIADFTEEVITPLDYNTIMPILKYKPIETFSICTETFEELIDLLKQELGEYKRENNALVLMRIKKDKATQTNSQDYGWKIAELFTENSIVTWAAQSYDKYRFDFYIYNTIEEEEELQYLNSEGVEDIKVKCENCGKGYGTVIQTIIKRKDPKLQRQTFICEECAK